MNVRKKVKLTHVFESYWDMLPPELHEIITAHKRGQECIDKERKERMKDLCDEIKKYGDLKRKWEIGHIKCIVKKEMCFNCYRHHLKIMGVMRMRRKSQRKDSSVTISLLLWNESIV